MKSRSRIAQIEQIVKAAIDQQVFPGCVIGVVNGQAQRIIMPFGKHTYERAAQGLTAHSIFDIASVTKSIPISCLALKLVEMGLLDLNAKVVDLLPEFNNSYRHQLLVWHLLTQTIDCNYRLSDYKTSSPQEMVNVVLKGEFNSPPGAKHYHTNAATILLGLVIERSSGDKIPHLSDQFFFEPLGMKHTTYDPNKFSVQDFVPTEFDNWRGRVLQGEVQDEASYILLSEGYPAPAGVFSTSNDLLTFMEMLMNGGRWNGHHLLSEDTVRQIYTNQLENFEQEFSMGWDVNRPNYMGRYATPFTFGRTGFAGCSIVCDPLAGLALVILTNYHFPKRKHSLDQINLFRREAADLILDPLANFHKELPQDEI